MVDRRRLSLMRKTAFIVNTSRGEVIDEAALLAVLQAGEIGGAGLDVFEKEPPPPDTPVVTAPRTITTQHIAGQTEDSQRSAITIVGAKINQFFARRE
jgi:D-3-phosphoglycerate dehydrogenase / 2-oxoglutarate reductase